MRCFADNNQILGSIICFGRSGHCAGVSILDYSSKSFERFRCDNDEWLYFDNVEYI